VARLVLVADAGAVAEAAADRVAAVLGGAIEMRGVAHLALTGGSSAAALYAALLTPIRRAAVDWSRVEAWWGDDRLVRRSDALSNVLVAESILQPEHGLGLDPRRVHPFPIDEADASGHEASWVAETYAARLREHLPADGAGDPILDLVLLGMGSDGHILSVFPGSAALEPGTPIVMAVPAPTHIEPHVARVTINPRLVGAARAVLVICSGAAKADRLAEVLEGPVDVGRLPAQLACGPNATWIVDRAAASGLQRA
jgi:6-phosphogluconolactonase